MTIQKMTELFPGILMTDFLRYFIAASIAYLLFWVIGKKRWRHRIIQNKRPTAKRMWTEFKYSLSTVIIFALVGSSIVQAKIAGYTLIYNNISERGWWWFFTSILLIILLHDAWFYWAHRLMHHPKLFKHVHLVHHQSTNPSPWAAYSFHPLEAIIEASIFPVVVFTIPAHPFALLTFLIYMITRNVLGHLGIEIFPRWFVSSKWFNWHTTVTHHDLHHRDFNQNYGLYFTWWDRWMGTEHQHYQEEFEEVTSRPQASDTPSAPTVSKLSMQQKRSINPRLIAILIVLSVTGQVARAQSIIGSWQSFDEDTGRPLAQIQIKETGNDITGTIVQLDLPPWAGPNPICSLCEGHRKDQPIIGMEMLWGFEDDGPVWRSGHILDPASGDIYDSKMWLESTVLLKVRGYGGPFNLFYRTQDWLLQHDGGDEHPLTGIWKTIDDASGLPKALVEINVRNGQLSGTIRELLLTDPICSACPGERRGSEIVGLTILSNFQRDESESHRWINGQILDPGNGKTYTSAVWLEGANTLKVRGYWGPFHRTQTWQRINILPN